MLAAYATEFIPSEQVVFVDDLTGHIHSLTRVRGGPSWAGLDLAAVAKASPMNGPALDGFEGPTGAMQGVMYLDMDGHVHELGGIETVDNPWSTLWAADITLQAGSPATGALIAASASTAGDGKQVALRGAGGHVYELCGRHLVLHEHNDLVGYDLVQKIARLLGGIAASIKMFRYTDLAEHGDVSDWLDLGHTRALIRRLPAGRRVRRARLPDHQRRRQHRRRAGLCRLAGVAEAVEQRRRRQLAHLPRRLPDRRQWRVGDGGPGMVLEREQPHVVGTAQAQSALRLQRAYRQHPTPP